MKQAGVVILNWNGKALLEAFLPSVTAHTPEQLADVVVADNGSTDDSLAFLSTHYPDVKQIALNKNYGFAEGYNRALEMLSYKYVVLLNSDVEVTPGWLSEAIDYLEAHPGVTALQPKLLAQQNKSSFEYAGACGGYLDALGYPFCRGRLLATVEEDRGQYDTPADILWGSGACLIIRLDDYKEAGGLDAHFFAHQEEIDLCWRLNARGKRIVSFPQSVVYHVGGATLEMEHPRKTFLNFRNNLLMLYKNLPDTYYNKVMRIRWLLDYLAALQFVLKGAPRNAWAVVWARREFHRMKRTYQSARETNLRLSQPNLPEGVIRKSLLVNYYLKGKKTFNQLIATDKR